MTILKYTGTSHFREISKADFTHLGFDQGAIKVARHDIFPEHNWKGLKTTVELDDDAAQWLLDNESSDWAVVEDEDDKDEETPAAKKKAAKKASEKNPPDPASDAPGAPTESPSVTTGGTSTASS